MADDHEAGLILAFLRGMRSSLDQLRVEYSAVERTSGGLHAFPRSGGGGVREGVLGNGTEFSLHGAGCSFELTTGEFVDIDWDHDGDPIFDVYRLQRYAQSLGRKGEWTDDQLREAANGLVSSGELIAMATWYALPPT